MQNMFRIRIADLAMDIYHEHTFVFHQCKDYQIEPDGEAQLTIRTNEENIQKENLGLNETGSTYSLGYCESLSIYREIIGKLLPFQGFLLHAAVLDLDGKGYAFSAPSGTGKSTHISLWKQAFGEGVRVINGDKPIVRCIDGSYYAYGTPWCGKENWNTNDRTVLSGLCFLERGQKNDIRRAAPKEVADRLLKQVLLPVTAEEMGTLLDILEDFLKTVPCYVLSCNMDLEAAEVAYAGFQR